MALLAEMRAAQEELGTRIGKRRLAAAQAKQPVDWLAFAQSRGNVASTGKVRAAHRRQKGKYRTRMLILSKLDPNLATIESWLAAEPQTTALSITRRLAAIDPATFGEMQHSIVQRLLRKLRKQTALLVLPTPPSRARERSWTVKGLLGGAPSFRPFTSQHCAWTQQKVPSRSGNIPS